MDKRHRTVKGWATGLLILMVILYAVAKTYEDAHPAWHWVRAFAEAGMIGALADWFAVVALFRHPLGLPIPHTAIVKKQKDKIGASLGRFVRNNFLTAETLGDQLRKNELVKKALLWASTADNIEKIATFIERELPHLLTETRYREGCKRLSTVVCEKGAQTPVERGVGKWMEESMHGAEFRGVVAPLFKKFSTGIAENKEWVEEEAGARAPLNKSKILSRFTKGMTKVVSGHMVSQLAETLAEASDNLNHTFYDKMEASLGELGRELQSDEEQSEWARWRIRIFQSEGMRETVEEILLRGGELIVQEKSALKGGITHMVSSNLARIVDDPAKLNQWEEEVITFLTQISDHYGNAFEQLINSKVRDWDADSLTGKIEQSVGADLQFIRINGSLIGGVIGLLLHALSLCLWG